MKKKRNIFFVILFLGISLFVFFKNYNNFHVVINNELYRSAELDSSALKKYIKKYKIKTVFNLTGARSSSKDYKNEVYVCRINNVKLIDFKLKATKMVSVDSMELLINLLKKADKPILVHCRQGADRTSLVSALYLYDIKRNSVEQSIKMLSVKYGHLPSIFGRTEVMDSSFFNYVRSNRNENFN